MIEWPLSVLPQCPDHSDLTALSPNPCQDSSHNMQLEEANKNAEAYRSLEIED